MPSFKIENGPEIFYEDTGGSGVPIIFSHGLFMTRDMFGPQLEEFSKDHRCIVWDERAHGKTVWQGEFTYYDSADDLIALADHLGIDKFIHFGFSQGGLLALRAAIRYPDRFIGLIQCSTHASGLSGEAVAAFKEKIGKWADDGLTDETKDFLRWLILGEGVDEAFWMDYWNTMTAQQLADATYALYDAEAVQDRLHEVTAPTLVIHGLADVSTPLDLAQYVGDHVPDSRGTVLIENGPHAINLSHADQVNAATRKFVDEVTAEFEKGA